VIGTVKCVVGWVAGWVGGYPQQQYRTVHCGTLTARRPARSLLNPTACCSIQSPAARGALPALAL
jgi:hypothetical protein